MTIQPREKLFAYGAKALSDIELLAIILNTGSKGKNVLELARELIQEFGTLKKLLDSTPEHFCQLHGLGKAKCALFKAALEVGRRYFEELLPLGEKLRSSQQTKQFMQSRLGHYLHEVFACLFLDNRHRVIAFEELFQGTIHETPVYPREIIKRGLFHNASQIILAHNHPSGDPTPSAADHDITAILKQALGLVDIKLTDHIIVGHHACFSLAELGNF